MFFRNRADAGVKLAAKLESEAPSWENPLILALPRGGIVVAAEVARALKMPMTVFIVRKLGAPGNPEYAIGAIAEGGAMVLSPGWSPDDPHVRDTISRETERIARYAALYRGSAPLPPLGGRTLLLIDDGAATGATVKAALKVLRALEVLPAKLIVALPVAPPLTVNELRKLADEVVVLYAPPEFSAVSQFFSDFADSPDDVLRKLVNETGEAGSNGAK
jgi:putative phosphoribosyl transferase